MARKKSKQQGVGNKELVAGQKKPVSPGGAGGDAGLDRLKNQPMHTCCLLCHREFKDWGANSVNGLPGGHGAKLADTVGRKLADAVPSLSQSLLGEVPLWICQSCRKSVEEEERRSAQEEPSPVPLSHSSSCKSQSCGNGYPEHSSVDWDPSSFLSAHKLSGLWNSAHSNGGVHCNHNAASHSQQGGTRGPVCHEKRGSHEAPGKSAKTSGAKVCPYSHPSSQNSSGTSPGNPHSTSDLCKTTPKHFKTVCRRPTPPGEAFHPSDHHQHSDLSVPPNSPTGLSSQHSSLLPPKQSSGTHGHIPSSPSPGLAAHAPFSPLVPNLHSPSGKLSSGPDSPTALHKPSPCKNSHIPAVNTQHSKLGGSLMGCNHPCNGNSGATVAASNVGHLTAGACRDQACKGHKLANGTLCHAPSELEDGEDEDSSSERSSCASSSTNQKDGKYCDCCYCEFFGHNAPPAAPTSRNYAEIREKLRSRLTRRKEELPQRQDSDPGVASTIDNRDVDELLDFINNSEPKPTNSAKAAKRARHKQKKKEKEKSPGCMEAGGSDPLSTPPEPADDPSPEGSEASRLLEWPQLELERVNSFLTSRLEEIKNTIKDSIRASFSMYDLNLDVNDFPKKAATLEGNHLLSHLNGSTDLQQIDLDLAPLSLGNFRSHLDLVNGLTSSTNMTTAAGAATGPKEVQRLHSTPNLSKLIRIRSPEVCPSSGLDSQQQTPVPAAPNEAAKEDVLDSRNSVAAGAGAAASAAKVKKGKKQLQKQEQPLTEQNSAKHTKAASGNEFMSKGADLGSNSYKIGSRLPPPPQPLPSAESQRTVPKNPTESRPPRQATNGTATGVSNTHRSKSDTEKRGGRSEQESEGRGPAAAPTNGQQQQQQPKGKNKKNKNKGEKSSPAIDDVFLPKDVDATEMDEIDREVEYFKRFCLDSAKQTRQKVAVNWSNFSLKKVSSNAAQ